VLQAGDIVVTDGMDDGFHDKRVLLILRQPWGTEQELARWPPSSCQHERDRCSLVKDRTPWTANNPRPQGPEGNWEATCHKLTSFPISPSPRPPARQPGKQTAFKTEMLNKDEEN
jgi:hypothetical protein